MRIFKTKNTNIHKELTQEKFYEKHYDVIEKYEKLFFDYFYIYYSDKPIDKKIESYKKGFAIYNEYVKIINSLGGYAIEHFKQFYGNDNFGNRNKSFIQIKTEEYNDMIENYESYKKLDSIEKDFLKFLKSHGPVLQKDVSKLFGLEVFGNKINTKIHKLATAGKIIWEKQGKTYLIHINNLIKWKNVLLKHLTSSRTVRQ